jgi:type VI secretion system protein ImpF
MPSLLERLTDPGLLGTGILGEFNTSRMMNSVRRDLEDLFNTHDSASPAAKEYPQVRSSIVAYGLPDLPSLSATTRFQPGDVGRLIEELIARHEPRLRDVRVIMSEPDKDAQHRIRFRIEARLNVDPSPGVEFETILELATGQASIRLERE